MTSEMMTWDWKEYIDIERLAQIVNRLSDGKIKIIEVDTESDQFAIVVSNDDLTPEGAAEFYQRRWE